MEKKPLSPEEIKSEDIAKEIEKSLYGKETYSKGKAASMLLTFIALFVIYIFLVNTIENYITRTTILLLGLFFLVLIFQNYVLAAFKKSKKKRIL